MSSSKSAKPGSPGPKASSKTDKVKSTKAPPREPPSPVKPVVLEEPKPPFRPNPTEVAANRAAAVQKELQKYLDSKNFNTMFTAMVEHLLNSRPEDPVSSIIEYLFERFPDSARMAKISLTRDERPRSRNGPSHGIADLSDDDEEEDFATSSSPTMKRSQKRGKRGAISSESIDPAKMKEQMEQLPVIRKTPEATSALQRIVQNAKLLSSLDADAKDILINVLSGPVQYQAGQVIINQGEEGDQFYLIEEGNVDVFIKKDGEPAVENPKSIHSYGAGDSFGELALMYNAPRAATCRAATPCKLWTLDRKSFKVIVVGATILKREKYMSFLRAVPILQTLTNLEVSLLADSLNEEIFPEGMAVCTEGELGNYFYIITKGHAICRKKKQTEEGEEDESVIVGNLKEGNYFGEVALLTQKPRQATVTAYGGPLSVLSLDRATFLRLLGPIDDILRRNMTEYNKRIAKEI